MAITNEPILIAGLGMTNVTHDTTQDVVKVYNDNYSIVKSVFNKTSGVNSSDAAALNQAVQNLLALAQTGIPRPPTDSGIVLAPSIVTGDMGRQIDLLVRSLASVGVSPGGADVTGILRWQDLTGLGQVIEMGAGAGNRNRSLQALLELEYVGTGNQILADQLNSLYQAMTVTQGAVQTLSQIQSIHNQIKPEQRATLGSDIPGDVDDYNSAADELYKNPIALVVDYGGQSPNDLIQELTQLRKALASQLSKLDQLNPPQIVSGQPSRDPSSMSGAIANVLKDMEDHFGNNITQSELENWILDAYGSAGFASDAIPENQGAIQRHLDAALQAGTNLNDTQKQNFQRYLFVFQEFYQSACAMLNTINQDIKQMAQNIGR